MLGTDAVTDSVTVTEIDTVGTVTLVGALVIDGNGPVLVGAVMLGTVGRVLVEGVGTVVLGRVEVAG
jgi:hypothetical protein